MPEQPTSIRAVTFRLIPGTRAKARHLSGVAGACRYVWNTMLADQNALHDMARMHGGQAPYPSYFALCAAYTQLAGVTPWLREYSATAVRYTLKHQADAWRAFFAALRAGRPAGPPTFKARRGDDGVTLPQDIRIVGGRLWFPKLGWLTLRRRGGNPYAHGQPQQVRIRRSCGRWYATVFYAVPTVEPADNGLLLGVDMNVGQIAVSTGDLLPQPDTTRLQARRKRYQRMMARRQRGSRRRALARHRLRRTGRRIATVGANWQHQVSRILADSAGLVVVEDLRTQAMTRSARGTVACPGTQVRQKAGLNRGILGTGWAGLRRKLEYKAVQVLAENPAYTSQRCPDCGVVNAANRPTQARFACVSCGAQRNADVNAALNLAASGRGASGRGEALALAMPQATSVIRQQLGFSN